MDRTVSVFKDHLSKGTVPSFATTDAEQNHRVQKYKWRISLQYKVLDKREKSRETRDVATLIFKA